MNIRSMAILLGAASLMVSQAFESRPKFKVIRPTVDYEPNDEIEIENSFKVMIDRMAEVKRERETKKNVQKLLDTMPEPNIDTIEARINDLKKRVDDI